MNEVRRCDEMERKLRYIEMEVKKDDVPIPDNLTELPRAPNPREIINLEVRSPPLDLTFRRSSRFHFAHTRYVTDLLFRVTFSAALKANFMM